MAWGAGAEGGGTGEKKGEGRKEVSWRERRSGLGGEERAVVFLWRMKLCAPPGTWPRPYCYSFHHPCSHPHLHPIPNPSLLLTSLFPRAPRVTSVSPESKVSQALQ